MAQSTDLYSILMSYANKNNSPYIDINAFLDFLGKYAKKQSVDQGEWLVWTENTTAKFWLEASTLAEENKCELLTDTNEGRIYMPFFCLGLIENSYRNADKDADIPFPREELMKITFRENQARTLGSTEDIIAYLENPQEEDIPVIKIVFPSGFGSGIVLAGLFNQRLPEMAILKIRNYLKRAGNMEYALRKLSPQLQGRENLLREQLNQIVMRPMETCKSLKEAREQSYLFWAYFSILVKNDIKKKNEYLSEDIAAFQSVFLLEAFNSYYKLLANKRRDEEAAFRVLESRLSRPPFQFTMEEIWAFKDTNAAPLLGQYSREALDEWIKNKTTETKNNELPALLVLKGATNERHFCFKDKVLPLCFRLIAEGRKLISDALSKRWQDLILDYQHEPAMENDASYEKLLGKLVNQLCPALEALLADPKLILIYEEIERSQNPSSILMKIFEKGQLIPYSSLFIIKRKEIYTNIKLALPFWYSMPIITAIIAFFKRLTNKKKTANPVKENDDDNTASEGKDRAAEIRYAAGELEPTMVPKGYNLDTYLEELEDRWSRLIDKKAKENLITDVRSLLRDHLRQNLRLKNKFKVTREAINHMAEGAVVRSPALSALREKGALITYSELYLLQLLENIR